MATKHLKLFHNAESVILAVNASLRWFNNVKDGYLGQVFLFLFGQQGLGHFFRYWPCFPWARELCKLYANAGGK
jgi:hypothetical protein